MSKVIKLTVSDENYDILISRAGSDSIQDYIRAVLFPDQISFTPLDAINRALSKYKVGDTFSVPEIYDKTHLDHLPRGVSGQLGRGFSKLVENDYSNRIEFTGLYNQ